MNFNALFRTILLWISWLTIASGLFQLIAPSFELMLLSASSTTTSAHFFAIIGMFMVIFGCGALDALVHPSKAGNILLWAALQKYGAFIAVTLGVIRAVFSPLALMVAGFDLVSGILITIYWQKSRKNP